MIENKKILVLGMGKSGTSVAKFLSKNNTIIISDMKEQKEEDVLSLETLGVKVVITEKQEDLVDESIDLVIKNPGIRKDANAVVKAKNLNIEVINEVEVACKYLPKDVCIIAVTGSNGKTTTTTLIHGLLNTKYDNVHLGGNIGIPFCDLIKDIKENDTLVLEISDHQLLDMYDFKANIAVLTNLSEVHTDFHGTHENYVNTKKKIFNNMGPDDTAIINKDNEESYLLTKDILPKKLYFSSKEKTDIYLENDKIIYNGEEIIDINDLTIKGLHNYENIMVAILIAKMFDVDNEKIKTYLKDFKGVEHRIEFVRSVNKVKYYNDSKSTNNVATITALKSFKEPVIIIMGGLDRNIPFDEISPYLTNVKTIICYGETKEKLKEFALNNNKEVFVFDNLKEATIKASEIAREGEVVLLSPACASWDQYENFEIRGNEFKDIVNSLN